MLQPYLTDIRFHGCIYIYIYICNHENNVPSRLSPQWLCGNSCTWAHVILYINYAHLASVRFEHSVCCGSLVTIYIYLYIYIYIFIFIPSTVFHITMMSKILRIARPSSSAIDFSEKTSALKATMENQRGNRGRLKNKL